MVQRVCRTIPPSSFPFEIAAGDHDSQLTPRIGRGTGSSPYVKHDSFRPPKWDTRFILLQKSWLGAFGRILQGTPTFSRRSPRARPGLIGVLVQRTGSTIGGTTGPPVVVYRTVGMR